MVNGKWTVLIYSSFLVYRPLKALYNVCHSPIHTHSHTDSTASGAVRSSVSFSRTLPHTLWRSLGSNKEPSGDCVNKDKGVMYSLSTNIHCKLHSAVHLWDCMQCIYSHKKVYVNTATTPLAAST